MFYDHLPLHEHVMISVFEDMPQVYLTLAVHRVYVCVLVNIALAPLPLQVVCKFKIHVVAVTTGKRRRKKKELQGASLNRHYRPMFDMGLG